MNRLEQLKLRLGQYDREYYDYNEPTVPDSEYDRLLAEVLELDPNYCKIGCEVQSEFKKVKHCSKMYSLNKVHNTQEVLDWHRSLIEGGHV